MGYTHYWVRPESIDPDTFRMILCDFKIVHKLSKLDIAGITGKGKPTLNRKAIAFNGSSPDTREAFVFDRTVQLKDCWGSCKVFQGTPHDTLVTSCLIIAKRYMGSSLKVTSDGVGKDWQPAKELCQSLLGYGKHFRLERF